MLDNIKGRGGCILNLKTLISRINVISSSGALDKEVTSIHYNSKECAKNSIFIAIKGYEIDGHRFIESAIENGATAIVYESDNIEKKANVTYIKVEDSRSAMALLGNTFYNDPSKKINMIGVTGTNGKTSVSFLIREILKHYGEKVGVIGTLGTYIGDEFHEGSRTTPESIELNKTLTQIVDLGIKYTVMEVSSHAQELKRVEDIKYKIAVFTNLSQDHLDFHGDIENYFLSKTKLFTMTDKANIINGDDPYGKRLIKMLNNNKTLNYSYGMDNNCDFIAQNIRIDSKGTFFDIKYKDFHEEFYINTPGLFSVYNAMAAIIVSYLEDIPMSTIKEALKNSTGVPGRFEHLKINKDYSVIIDYAHTPDGLENVLKTINDFANKKIITVFGCGGDRDRKKRPLMGEIAGKYSDYCVVTSDNPRNEEPMSIIKDILPGLDRTNCAYSIIENRKNAIKKALDMAQKNDIILIAGKGHETYQILKDKTISFDEKKIIDEILNEDEKYDKDDNKRSSSSS